MYGITFGFDLKNQSQLEDICGFGTTICLDINSKRDLGYYKKYARALISAATTQTDYKLIVSMNNFFTSILIKDIFYVEVFKRIISIHHKNGVTDTYAQLSDTENILSVFGFIRVHRAYIASISTIMTLSSEKITLINGEEIPVGKKYFPEVKKVFLSQGIRLGK